MTNKELSKLIKERRNYLDYCIAPEDILRENHNSEFSEFIIDIGGDISTYRVYGNKCDGFTIACK